MKYVPDYYSDQLDTAVVDNEKVDVSDVRGKIRCSIFSFTASGAVAADSEIALALIPQKARVIDGVVRHSAYGAGRTLDLGLRGADNSGKIDDVNDVDDDVDFFLDGIAVSSAGADTFANLFAGDSNAQYQTQKEVVLIATILGNTLPDAGTLDGQVFYVTD